MKKFIITLLLAAFSVQGGAVFAEEAAVPGVVATERAVDNNTDHKTSLIFDLGILSADLEGNYHLEEEMTRIDFLIALYQMMNYADRAETPTMGESGYQDIGKYHFASGYVGYMSRLGITKGYPDGTFRPEQAVTLEEAYLMAVKAAGYFRGVQDVGGVQTLATARDIGLTKGIDAGFSEPLNKRNAAYLFYNLMFCDSLSELSFENDKIKQSTSEEFLSFYMNLEYEEGVIEGISGISLYDGLISENSLVLDGVEYENAKTYDESYLGSYVTVFYDRDAREVVSVMREERDNEILRIRTEDIDSYVNGVYNYYPEGQDRTRRARLAENPDILWNRYPGKGEVNMKPAYGEVLLVDHDKDGRYDVVQVYSYETYILESYTELKDSRTLLMQNEDADGKRVMVDLEDYERVKIFDRNGEELSVKSLKQNSAVTLCRAEDQILYLTVERNELEGTVRSVDREDGEERLLLADGSELLTVPSLILNGTDKLSSGSYTLVLDANGRVAMATFGGGSGWRYAYILRCSYNTEEDAVCLKLLDQANTVGDYAVSDKVTMDDVKYTDMKTVYDGLRDAYADFKNNGTYDQMTTRVVRYYMGKDNQIKKLDTPIRQSLYETKVPTGYNENNKLLLRAKGNLYSKQRASIDLVTIYQSDADPGMVGEVRAQDADKMHVFLIPDDDHNTDYTGSYQAQTLSHTQIYSERWFQSAGYNTDPDSIFSEVAVIRKPLAGEWNDRAVYFFDGVDEAVNAEDEIVEMGRFYSTAETPERLEFHENSPIASYQLKRGDLVLASVNGNRIKVTEILYRSGGSGTLQTQGYYWDTQLNANHRLVLTKVDRSTKGYWVVNVEDSPVPAEILEPTATVTLYDEAANEFYVIPCEEIRTREIYGDNADDLIYKSSIGTLSYMYAIRKAK